MTVSELMSRDVITCKPDNDVTDAIRLMFQHKIRHLPVIEEGLVCGMISLRAAMESRLRTRRWSGAQPEPRPESAYFRAVRADRQPIVMSSLMTTVTSFCT